MDSSALQASYEAVPYESHPITVTHPDRIAAIAMLHGLTPPPVDSCRLLELGCAAGGNLVPMALGFPDATFVGVDFAPSHIERGRREAAALGIPNLSFEAMSIADIEDSLGTFDYIICHGVYSWVPPEVQAATLRVCARNLAPNGLAYVSYNTYPGWHVRRMADDMIRFHDDPSLNAEARVDRGRAFIAFAAAAAPPQASRYADMLRDELRALESESVSHFVHEQLEAVNEPVHFEEFANRAALVGLQYVAEAQPSALAGEISDDARETIRAWSGNVVRYEQYLDFLRCRTFRRTLLCHQALPVQHEATPDRLFALHVAGRCEPVAAAADDAARGGKAFRNADGVSITTNNPFVIAALDALQRVQPATLPFAELWRRVRDRVDANLPAGDPLATDDPLALAAPLLQCVSGRLLELHACPGRAVSQPSGHPIGSVLARHQARITSVVTSLRHAEVELDALDRYILGWLDGSRDRAKLVSELHQAIVSGAIRTESPVPVHELPRLVELSLTRLARAALLEA